METEIKNETEARVKALYGALKACRADIQDMVLDAALRRGLAKTAVRCSGKPVQRIIGKFAARSGRRAGVEK